MTGQLFIERHAVSIENAKAAGPVPVSGSIPGAGPTTRAWRRRKDARPQEILAAALAVFAERGFAAARMDDIAVARARLQRHDLSLLREQGGGVPRADPGDAGEARFAIWPRSCAIIADRSRRCSASCCCVSDTWSRTSDLVVLPKMVIAEAGNFPDLARIYREEVVERGLTLFGGLLQAGMERGEFRKMPVQHAVRLCIAPLLLAAIWRTTFAAVRSRRRTTMRDWSRRMSRPCCAGCRRRSARHEIGTAAIVLLACLAAACTPEENTRWLGYVEGEAVLVAPPQPGWITSLNVTRGAQVKEGDPLFTLDAIREAAARDNATAAISAAREQGQQAAAQLAQAQAEQAQIEADIVRAEKEFARQQELVRIGGSPRRDLEAAQAAYDSATRAPQPGAGAARPGHGRTPSGRCAGEASDGEPRYGGVQSLGARGAIAGRRGASRTSISARANMRAAARRWCRSCRRRMCSCGSSCRRPRFRSLMLGTEVHIGCDGCAADLTAHDQLHRVAMRSSRRPSSTASAIARSWCSRPKRARRRACRCGPACRWKCGRSNGAAGSKTP